MKLSARGKVKAIKMIANSFRPTLKKQGEGWLTTGLPLALLL